MTQTTTLSRAQRKSRANKGKQVRRRPPIRRYVVAAVIVALGIGAVTWRVTSHNSTAKPSAAAVGSGTASGEPQPFVPNQVPESTFTRQPPFKGAAVAKFGQPAVQKAYREVVNFAFNAGWNSELMLERMSKLTKRDFAGIRAFMTPSCAKAFDTLVSKALGHDKAATRELEGAAFFALAASGGGKPIDGPGAVTNRRFSRAAVTLDKSQHLVFTFAVKATVHMRNAAGKSLTVPTTRRVRYVLVPNSGADAKTRPFLIEAWANRLQVGKLQAG